MTLVWNPEGWKEESAAELVEEAEREPSWSNVARGFTGDHQRLMRIVELILHRE